MQTKPCPFCYSTKAEATMSTLLTTHEVQVMCPKCGTRGPVFHNIEHGHDWAVQAWNQLARTIEDPKEEIDDA